MIIEFLAVGIGGFIGSCFRFALTRAFNYFSISFPFGTLMSNVIAGIAIGVIVGLEQQCVWIAPKTRLFLTTGLLGGLSTFSTFSLETVQMIQDNDYLLASGNVLLNLMLSLLGVALGILLVRILIKDK